MNVCKFWIFATVKLYACGLWKLCFSECDRRVARKFIIIKDVKKSRQKNEKVAADIWKVAANSAGNGKSCGISEKSRKNLINRDRAMLKSILRDQQDFRSTQKEIKKDKLCNIIIIIIWLCSSDDWVMSECSQGFSRFAWNSWISGTKSTILMESCGI